MAEPIRVLHAVGTMGLGGAEALIMNLYRNIDRTKIQFDFLCQNKIQAAYTDEIYALGGKMYKVDGPSHSGFFGYQKQLSEFFLSHPEYTIVHAHQFILNGLILKAAKEAGVQNRYSHSHAALNKQCIKDRIISDTLKLYINSSNVTRSFACARAAGDFLYHGALRTQCEIIPNAIDTDKFIFSLNKRKEIRKEFGVKDEILIGHVGRFMYQKNHVYIIDIFNEILKTVPNARLILVGEGELKSGIIQKVKQLGIEDSVIFAGYRNDVADLLSSFDLLLFPSNYEGLSVVCVEAQASGLPILTSTGVSSEICLTELVRQIPLSDSVEIWAKDALNMITDSSIENRSNYADEIKDKGFDIKMLSERMQELYLGDALSLS